MNKLTAEVARREITYLNVKASKADMTTEEIFYLQALEIALPVLEQGGWIEWGGSPCPVANNTDVEVRRGDGYVVRGKAADFYWQTRGLLGSVIAYRVIENDGREG